MANLKYRWGKTRKWFTTLKRYGFFAIAFGLDFAFLGEVYLNKASPDATTWFYSLIKDFCANVTTSLIFIGIAIVIFDSISESQQQARDQKRLKLRATSRINSIAVDAVEEMRLNDWLEGEEGLLAGEVLVRANLSEAPLSGANLVYTNFSIANLSRANLSDTVLAYNKLLGTNLYRANFTGARILNAEFQKANLVWANFRDAIIKDVFFAQIDLSKADFRGAIIKDCKFQEVNLTMATLTGVDFSGNEILGVDFSQTYLMGASFEGVDLTYSKFENADFLLANLKDAIYDEREIIKAGSLHRAIMSDGYVYDGRYNIEFDKVWAQAQSGKKEITSQDMANYFGVTLEAYEKGQEWAKDNLERLKSLEE